MAYNVALFSLGIDRICTEQIGLAARHRDLISPLSPGV
jgi:hypothetical protein